MAEDDLEKVEAAKVLAAGPLGDQQSKFPLRFAKAAFFGERPSRENPTLVRNGTIAFVDFGNGPIGITCAHVIEAYRNLMDSAENVVFQLGDVEISPIDQLIDESIEYDLATIDFSETQINAITAGEEIGSCIFKPVQWPSSPAMVGESVVFGGFPEVLRETPDYDEVVFPSWSSGGSLVTSAYDERFSCQFEREYWVSSFGSEHHLELRALSGISGGPAFAHRGLYFDLVGVTYEFSTEYDVLFSVKRN